MPKLLIDSSIPYIDTYFSKHFEVTCYQNTDELKKNLPHQEVLVCRTHTRIDAKQLGNHQLRLIATASSGRDHIKLPNASVPILDAKGANAWAVSDYILCVLAQLKISTQHNIGIIGFGHVGKTLGQRLSALNYQLKIHDPFILVPEPWHATQDEILNSDIILIHCEYHHQIPNPTHHLINAMVFKKLMPHTILINAARGDIVDEKALLESPWTGIYCTDVYQNEPQIQAEIIQRATLCTPHIAGHSIEAKERITKVIANQVHAFFQLKTEFQNESKKQLIPLSTWQQDILKHYDPMNETRLLKAHSNPQYFTQLRSLHQRHEFILE